jgi:hypothetical protein
VGKLLDAGRVVALVGDGDDTVPLAEREQHLGGRRHERRDAHGIEDGTSASCYARRVCR